MPDAYFARIGYPPPVTASRATLDALVAHHVRTFPFENLSVLIGTPMPLDTATVWKKFVRDHRGGYCFEHATVFAAVLQHLGYTVQRRIARVLLGKSDADADAPPETHALLTVTLGDKRFLIDPGFGDGRGPGTTIGFEDGAEAYDAAGRFRLRAHPYGLVLQRKHDARWTNIYVVAPRIASAEDFETSHHYSRTHPDARFVSHLAVHLRDGTQSAQITDDVLTLRRGGYPSVQIALTSRDALLAALAEHFGLHVPEVRTMRVPAVVAWR